MTSAWLEEREGKEPVVTIDRWRETDTRHTRDRDTLSSPQIRHIHTQRGKGEENVPHVAEAEVVELVPGGVGLAHGRGLKLAAVFVVGVLLRRASCVDEREELVVVFMCV